MRLLRRRFPGRSWLILFVPLLLSAAFAAAADAPSAVTPLAVTFPAGNLVSAAPFAQAPAPELLCLDAAGGKDAVCEAKDVGIGAFQLLDGPAECLPGEEITVTLRAELEATARFRYDIGLYVAQDGGDARTGACYRDFLPPPLVPFTDTRYTPDGGPYGTAELPADTCGDLQQDDRTFRYLGADPSGPDAEPEPIRIVCQDNVDASGRPEPNGLAEVGTCVSWDNQGDTSPACTSLGDLAFGTTSKCSCSYLQIAGLTVPEAATIRVVKRLVPETDPGLFDLLVDGEIRSGAEGVGNNGETESIPVTAGEDHTIGEVAHAGTDLDAYRISYACVKNNETTPFVSGTGPMPFTVNLPAGSNAVCTFTNTARPRLRLDKIVTNNNGGVAVKTDWTLSATGAITGTPTNLMGRPPVDSAAVSPNFQPDTYTLSETYTGTGPVNGYTASAWNCVRTGTGEPVTVSPDSQVTIEYGDDVTCTITNDDVGNQDLPARLRLVKKVENGTGGTATADDFQASVWDGANSTPMPWDTFVSLEAGRYEAIETVLDGYTASAWSGDCAADGSITLAPGEEKTCTITNSYAPPPDGDKVVCVEGYVIGQDEQGVDGTQTVPPLVVKAVRSSNQNEVLGTAPVGTDGYFKFTGLPAGASITFLLQLPPGWEGIVPQAPAGGLAVTVPTSFPESNTCYLIFFKVRPVGVPVIKWEEQLDGTVVPGEGWEIIATPMDDPFASAVTATITGGRALLPLTPGRWTVAETLKPGWTAITPPSVVRVIDEFDFASITNPIVFKNRAPVCHGRVIITKEGFGTTPAGEPQPLGTLTGWTFTLSRADGTATPVTKTTGGDGRAVFDNLSPGVYKVSETVQPGWAVRGDNPAVVTLRSCETKEVTFENEELTGTLRIYGTKWLQAWESPYNGTLIGLPGWAITATLVGTTTSVVTVTDALGQYEFTQDQLMAAKMAIPGASIEVCEETREHWIAKTPECVKVDFPYPLPPSHAGAKVDFINAQDPATQP